jgi:hypothetical protein
MPTPTPSTLPITNVVNISVASPQAGLADYQVNNVAILSKEVPLGGWSGATFGFAVYLSPQQVALDWGVGSETYTQAVSMFSQVPNPLTGQGQLIVYAGSGGQTLTQMIQALQPSIFFGLALYAGYNPNAAEVEAAASYMQSQGLGLGVTSNLVTDIQAGGLFVAIRNASQNFAFCFYYGIGTDGVSAGSYQAARIAGAAYFGRLYSTNFNGSNTTSTMQMKDLKNVQPDPTVTQTVLNLCENVGVDCFGSIAGLPKVFSNGGSSDAYFADNTYNLEWLTFALEVALFNVIAETNTKIPQTESGIALLKDAVIQVLQQGVVNGYIAPGAWNSTTFFGNPATLIANVNQTGFYVYTQPVNQQSQTQRAARIAPLIQVAIKLAGAVHSASCLVNINP